MGIYTAINIIEMVLIKKTYYQFNITVDYEPSLILQIYCNYGRPLKKINVHYSRTIDRNGGSGEKVEEEGVQRST